LLYVVGRISVSGLGRRPKFAHDAGNRAANDGAHPGFKSPACQESALHGLGHWQRDHDRQVNAIIDGFLAANPHIDARLIRYANAARCGCVL
jgi:hypothetical protein